MNEMNLDELFGFTAEQALEVTESKKGNGGMSGVYKPNIKDEKCKDNNYRALIRFMPFVYEDKVRTTIERWECFLKDVNDQNGVFVVSPKTVKKKCPIREIGWSLYSSQNAIDKANSKKINVYQQWYALIEIVKDVQHPELNGTFAIYQFGKKIYDKIEIALKGSEFTEAFNPFDFLSARLFEINMTKGDQKMDNGREVADYTACGFIEKKGDLHFGKEGEIKTMERSRESMNEYLEWLKTDAPKINNFQWKEWDQETTDKVNANLATYKSGFSAPRTNVASANETVKSIIDNQPKVDVEDVKPKVEMEDTEAETVSTDDDDWVKSVLNN